MLGRGWILEYRDEGEGAGEGAGARVIHRVTGRGWVGGELHAASREGAGGG